MSQLQEKKIACSHLRVESETVKLTEAEKRDWRLQKMVLTGTRREDQKMQFISR